MISVIICTYNRADLLAGALESVCQQSLAASAYEIVVIDNNSTDETPQVSRAYAERYPNVRYYTESQQGLSYARNRGWQEARGEYVAYIDDDCQAPASWLAVGQEVIEHVAPDGFGGPYFAFYKTPKPPWFKDAYGSWLPFAQATAVAPDILHGGNLFLRRDLLAKVGGFDPTLGMKGSQMAYGEETALLHYLQTTQIATRFYYEPRLFVSHLVRPEKLSLWWQLHSTFMHGRAYHAIYGREQPSFPWWAYLLLPPYTLFIGLRTLWQSWLWRDRVRYPYWQNYLYESDVLTYYIRRLGAWASSIETYRRLYLRRNNSHDA